MMNESVDVDSGSGDQFNQNPKSRASTHGLRGRKMSSQKTTKTIKNLTLFLPKLLKEVGKTGKVVCCTHFTFSAFFFRMAVAYLWNTFSLSNLSKKKVTFFV